MSGTIITAKAGQNFGSLIATGAVQLSTSASAKLVYFHRKAVSKDLAT